MGRRGRLARTYLYRYDWEAGTCSNTHEWCAPGVRPLIGELQDVSFGQGPDIVSAHRAGEGFYLPDATSSVVSTALRQLLAGQGVTALMAVPLMVGDRCVGLVGGDAVDGPRRWTGRDGQLLRMLAELLVNAIARAEAHQLSAQVVRVPRSGGSRAGVRG